MTGPLRTVLAVLLATALLGAGLPAAERAGEARTATRLDGATTRLATAAERLATRNDPTRTGAARRTIRVRIPPDGRLRVGRGTLAWRVDGGPWHRRHPSPDIVAGRDRFTLVPGRHRLRLSLQLRRGTPVVSVVPAPGD
jgi:hypothetical protein